MVWDAATGERLHIIRDKTETMMAIQDLTIDATNSSEFEVTLVSSSSDPHIRRWHIERDSASQSMDSNKPADPKVARSTILEHDTSVYKVFFAGDEDENDLWTASADGTAKCLSRAKDWNTEETYEHGDYVRAVVVTSDWVVTAGRDEEVKIWDRATGKLRHVYAGHYEEITALVLRNEEKQVVSVSIDGTVRSWGLTMAELDKAMKEKDEQGKGKFEEEKAQPEKNLLTAVEEAELAELMDSDE